MRTRLTELLGVEHPVMLAGMGGVSYAELASAVSEAGGFGCLGASTMGNEKMVAEMAAVREATAKPFGVDSLKALISQALFFDRRSHRRKGTADRRPIGARP